MIVFKKAKHVFTRIALKAKEQPAAIQLDWDVTNQEGQGSFKIERSGDGKNFKNIGYKTENVNKDKTYVFTDLKPLEGENIYRITNIIDKRASNHVKVIRKQETEKIAVFPNPVQADKVVNITLAKQPKGIYDISVSTNTGEVIYRTSIDHQGETTVYPLKVNNLVTHGNYMVYVTGSNKKQKGFKIIY
jgi:hypothetical protein